MCCKMTGRNINGNKWAGAENDLRSLFKKNVSVGWHCPAVDWQGRAMATQTDQAACQAVNIDSAVVLLVCDMAE